MLLGPIKVYLITEHSKNSIHRVFRVLSSLSPALVLPARENFAEAADITQQPPFNSSYFAMSE